MVEGSTLGFRVLCRRHNVQLTYTPMIHSLNFVRDTTYRKTYFTTCPEDYPVVAQFAGNDPQVILSAAKHLEDMYCRQEPGAPRSTVVAVDVNLGCPQKIAKKGKYGAFVADKPDLVQEIVSTLSKNLSLPVFCKMRVRETVEQSVSFATMLEKAGCKLLAVHGRLRNNLKKDSPADWESIAEIKKVMHIPVLANGGMRTWADCQKCLEVTKADGVMIGMGLLLNPCMCQGPETVPDYAIAQEFVEICRGLNISAHTVRGLLIKMCLKNILKYTDIRNEITELEVFEQADLFLHDLEYRVKNNVAPEACAELIAAQDAAAPVPPAALSLDPPGDVWRTFPLMTRMPPGKKNPGQWVEVLCVGTRRTHPSLVPQLEKLFGAKQTALHLNAAYFSVTDPELFARLQSTSTLTLYSTAPLPAADATVASATTPPTNK
eukprot:TRINITY_DN3033_c0_g4_i1.p1 TRINITY_DN3033_c0_g4~~TRINITY_DN3033_c0_g4_i1.p1  ORF type:complete len:473 (-),score=115.69 TRINITY_DN3033_c0_g4_i1:63-1364(-)